MALLGAWGASARNVWLVGQAGTILRYDGTTWAAEESGTTQDLRAVWGSDVDDVWVVGDRGTILHWNGKAWSLVPSRISVTLNAV